MRDRWWYWIILLGLGLPSIGSAQMNWVHPGLLNRADHYTLMRQKVQAGEQPWLGAYQSLPETLNHTPRIDQATYQVLSGGPFFPDLGVDGHMAYAAALQWLVSGNSAYAAKSIQIINNAVNTLQQITGDIARNLQVSWQFPWMIYAAEILRHTPGSGWSTNEVNAFIAWGTKVMVPFFHPVKTVNPSSGRDRNNWAAFGTEARLAWAAFTENQTMWNTAVDDWVELTTFYISRHSAGSGVFDGFTWETCRVNGGDHGGTQGGDLAHASLGMAGLQAGAEIIKQQRTANPSLPNPYAFLGADDGWGLRTAFVGHSPFFWFPQRLGSSDATWPCDRSLDSIDNNLLHSWTALYNQYGDSVFSSLANYQGNPSYNYGAIRGMAIPWDRLTHNNAGLVPEPEPPSEPGGSLSVAYASPTGSGTACTQASPCLLATAGSQLTAGGTLILLNGTHAACLDCLPSGSATQPTVLRALNRSGSATSLGTEGVAVNLGQATLQGTTGAALRLGSGKSFIRVEGVNFTTTGSGSTEAVGLYGQDLTLREVQIEAPTRSGGDGACLKGSSSSTARVRVERSRIRNCGPAPDYASTPTYHGVNNQGLAWVIEDSDIELAQGHGLTSIIAGGSTSANTGALIRRSRIRRNGGQGVFIGGGVDLTVTRNVVTGNGDEGIYVSNTCQRCQVYNNTIQGNSLRAGPTKPGIFFNTSATGIVRNNLVLDHPGEEISILGSTTAVACTDNLISDATVTTKCSTTTLNGVTADLFTDPANADPLLSDFSLQAGSAALDNGTTGICTDTDTGANRCSPALTLTTYSGAGVDQGALETDAPVLPAVVSHWPLATDATDSVGPNHGTATGVTFSDGSALFDAVDDRVVVPFSGIPVTGHTFIATAQTDTLTGARFLVGHSSNPPSFSDLYKLVLDTGRLRVGLGNVHTLFTDTGLTWETGRFYVVVLRLRTDKTGDLWIDGTKRGTFSFGNFTRWGSTVTIGNSGVAQQNAWSGRIKDVQIANYVWSDAEIAAHCATACEDPVAPFDPLDLDSCVLVPGTTQATMTCAVVGNPDPAVDDVPTQYTLAVNTDPESSPAVFSTATSCTLTGGTPAQFSCVFPDIPQATDTIDLVRDDGTDLWIWPVVYQAEAPTFDPLIMRDGTTDATCQTITVTLQGRPDPMQSLAHFVVRDDCDQIVPLESYAIAHGGATSTLTLTRAAPCDSANTAILVGYIPTNQTIGITNAFVPGGTPTGIEQVAYRCRPDATSLAERWLGAPNETCRAPAPGRMNLRVALVNDSGTSLDNFATRLYVARKDVGQSFGNFEAVTRPQSLATIPPIGAFYPPEMIAERVPDQSLLTTPALDVPGSTFTGVGLVRQQPSQASYPSLSDGVWWEEEHVVQFAEGLPIGTEFCFQVRDHTGVTLDTYAPTASGCSGALVRISTPRWLIR